MSYNTDLFPSLTPFHSDLIDVGNGHSVYYEQCGNPYGKPMLFLHGGPGAGCSSIHRRFFDPEYYRIILVDQRGCGRSTPTAEIKHNTTTDLIKDLETIRKLLEIEKWFVFGGSWGSTLAIAYGIQHPERCLGFILRGVFLAQDYECDWFLNRMGTFEPEATRHFYEFLPADERDDIVENYVKRLNDENPDIHLPAAYAWSKYEEACATLMPLPERQNPDPKGSLCLARLEAHYFKHRFFLEEGYLLEKLHKIIHLPCIIVQGRYDLVCPPITAEKLARKWARAQFIVIPDAGHSALEKGIRTALVGATQSFKQL